jgi:hypothetical protein
MCKFKLKFERWPNFGTLQYITFWRYRSGNILGVIAFKRYCSDS